ncbi:MAG: 16S rRNA (cytidine(1402)-2'-O)-methyltransferase [Ignavibacteria bacterium]|nr:16S rRNA (cytidine(1402)-2'-O)-methyltransferase [Ignavibacteria bacterium]
MRKKKEASILYIVSTPIGNEDDISLRALKVLKKVDAIICEEEKIGALLIKRHNFSAKLEQLNEHNEEYYAPQLIERMQNGETFALISDAGTPIFADPGRYLLQLALDAGINIVVVPGASSIMTALVRSGFQSDVFTCAGFLSRTTEERLSQLQALALEPRTTILLETPYRLKQLLEAANKVIPDRKAYIGCNLTMAFEHHHYGTFSELFAKFTESPFKGEFVIVFEGHPGRTILSVLETSEKKKIRSSERKGIDESEFEKDESRDSQREFRKRSDFSKERSPRFTRSDDKEYKKRDDGGGYKKREDGGYKKRDGGGGYKKRDDGGGFKKREDGGYKKREDGGYKKREDGGYKKREDGGYKKREDGGYKKREDGGYKKREDGGYKKRDGGGYKKREDEGYKKRDDAGGFKKRDDKRTNRGSKDAGMRPPRKRS